MPEDQDPQQYNLLTGRGSQLEQNIKKEAELAVKVKDQLSKLYKIEGDNVKVSNLDANIAGVSALHKIAEFKHKGKQTILHVKSAANADCLLESQLNEIFAYKVLENLGLGPKAYAGLIEPDTLLTITEDLNSPSRDEAQSNIFSTLQDNLGKLETNAHNQSRNLPTYLKSKLDAAIMNPENNPQFLQNLIFADLVKNIMRLCDIQFNPGNSGFTQSIDPEADPKLYIIDFFFAPRVEEHMKFRAGSADGANNVNQIYEGSRTFTESPPKQKKTTEESSKSSLTLKTKDRVYLAYQVPSEQKDQISHAFSRLQNGETGFLQAAEGALKYTQDFFNSLPEEQKKKHTLDPGIKFKNQITERFNKFIARNKEIIDRESKTTDHPSSLPPSPSPSSPTTQQPNGPSTPTII